LGLLLLLPFLAGGVSASAQSAEVQQLLLDVEKLGQLRRILSDMKQGYQVVSTGYNTVRDLSRGNFNLHQAFLDGLLQVSPAVRKYKRVQDIVNDQLQLLGEYKAAFRQFSGQGCFSPEELSYMQGVYTRLVDESLNNLDNLATVLTAGKLRMSDEERLQAIDGIYADMENSLSFLRQFNEETAMLAVQRRRAQNDVRTMQGIFGNANK
jgi:hypothetical protein